MSTMVRKLESLNIANSTANDLVMKMKELTEQGLGKVENEYARILTDGESVLNTAVVSAQNEAAATKASHKSQVDQWLKALSQDLSAPKMELDQTIEDMTNFISALGKKANGVADDESDIKKHALTLEGKFADAEAEDKKRKDELNAEMEMRYALLMKGVQDKNDAASAEWMDGLSSTMKGAKDEADRLISDGQMSEA